MKTEQEIRAQLVELKAARAQAETTLNAIANQEAALLFVLGELPEQAPAQELTSEAYVNGSMTEPVKE